MPDQETKKANADEKIAHQARTWRHAEKLAIGEKTSCARQAQYRALQKLRETVDKLGER